MGVSRQTEARKLPTGVRREVIAVACADMACRRYAGTAAQDLLPAHEFSIVFRRCAFGWTEARIGGESAACPFPDIAEHLAYSRLRRRRGRGMQLVRLEKISLDGIIQGCAFPFRFCGQTGFRPARKSVGFEIADVDDWFGGVDGPKAGKRRRPEFAVALFPVKRRRPIFGAKLGPAFRKPKKGIAIAAVADEIHPFGVDDQAIA